ncbi:hypothetical protein [Kribbella deserti]|uniref:Uncharacterized protein n=1 Tax=Kribbella deserti TaxID=1926257 RepID=A0ABV6QY25_9ACTN
MRKLIATVPAAALTTLLTFAGAAPAGAYMYIRNGYTFADTSYAGNVPGSYFKTTSRYDAKQGYLYIGLTGYDQICDQQQAAIRIRGWDVQTAEWRYNNILWVANPCKGQGAGTIAVPVRALGVDAVVVADGLRNLTYGRNTVRIWYQR